MHITHNNQTEALIDFDKNSAAINQTLNGDYSLSFFIHKTDRNAFCYDLVDEEAVVTAESENFIIKSISESPYGKQVTALHEFFELVDEQVDQTLADAWHSIDIPLSIIFANVDWTYQVYSAFDMAFLKGVGDDNPVALLNAVIDAFQAEYTVSSADKTVHIYKKIGKETDYQVRYKHNLVAIDKDIDASDVKTAIKVRYNKQEDGSYASIATYISPHANKYAKLKWAKTVEFDTDNIDVALAYGAQQIVDTPSIAITCEFVHLRAAGYDEKDIALGNSFYLHDPRVNENDLARIIAIDRYPFDKTKTPKVTLANRVKYMSDIAVEQRRKHLLLNAEAVKQKENYGGTTISEEGFQAVAEEEKGIIIMINAKDGILIKNGEIKKFYVDTEGNVTFDGRLLITKGDGITPMLEAFLDEHGGRLMMYDVDGKLNVKMGSEESGGGQLGGILKLYDDGDDRLRVQLGAFVGNGSGGALTLFDNADKARVIVQALQDSFLGGLIGIADETGSVQTALTLREGRIDGKKIATEQWVNDKLASNAPVLNLSSAGMQLDYDGTNLIVYTNGFLAGKVALTV